MSCCIIRWPGQTSITFDSACVQGAPFGAPGRPVHGTAAWRGPVPLRRGSLSHPPVRIAAQMAECPCEKTPGGVAAQQGTLNLPCPCWRPQGTLRLLVCAGDRKEVAPSGMPETVVATCSATQGGLGSCMCHPFGGDLCLGLGEGGMPGEGRLGQL